MSTKNYNNINIFILMSIIKIKNIFLILLFFLLPLINSRLLDIFWFDFNIYVSWNYEFTKVMFFNVLSWIIISVFFVENLINSIFRKEKIKRFNSIYIFLLLVIIFISSLYSISPFVSIFWNAKKWHSLIMFVNLIWLFFVLSSCKKSFIKKLIHVTYVSLAFSCLIIIKEYFFPTYNYWELSSRAIWTFWHPNYIALFILMIIPSLYRKLKSLLVFWIPPLRSSGTPFEKGRNFFLYVIILILAIVSLFLTKSAWGIFLFFVYNLYYFSINTELIRNFYLNIDNRKYIILGWIFIIVLIISIFYFFPYKLHSFISRFFIWESTLKLIHSDSKTLLFWWGFGTLRLVFDNYKSQYLYIFENIWFTADRPHNLLLNVFYHTWIFGLVLILYFIYKIIIKFKFNAYFEAVVLFLLFTIFNFSSIASYLLFILFLARIFRWKKNLKLSLKHSCIVNQYIWNLSISVILFVSLIWVYFSAKFYLAENYFYNKNYVEALNTYYFSPKYYYKLWKYEEGLRIEKFKSESYYISKLRFSEKIEESCKDLVNSFWSAENYFYCWDVLEKKWYVDLSKEFYKNWLNNLPDLWNSDSSYYKNFFIKNFINWNRFFSEKYSNLENILEKDL